MDNLDERGDPHHIVVTTHDAAHERSIGDAAHNDVAVHQHVTHIAMKQEKGEVLVSDKFDLEAVRL